MAIKSRSNQGDSDSVLSVVDPVKPKTVYRRCATGFALAGILLLITGAWFAVNAGLFAYLYMRYRIPKGLAFGNATRILLQRSLFGPQKSRLAIVAPFLISAGGSLALAWMANLLFRMIVVVLAELLYAASLVVADLTGRGKYFVVYKREGGNMHEVIDMEKGEKVVMESPSEAGNADDPGKGLWLRDPPNLTVAPFSAPISISVN